MADLTFNFSPLLQGMSNMQNRFDQRVMMKLSTSAARLENYAKQNRPWKDQTGQARQRLNCRASRDGSTRYKLTLAHGVSYGVDLEFKYNKRYAIIFPTLETQGPSVINDFNNFLQG